MPSHEQAEAEISLKLRNRAADMGLADAKSLRRSRHPTMAHHSTKKVDTGWIHPTYQFCMEKQRCIIWRHDLHSVKFQS
jgi:hypothetical protein